MAKVEREEFVAKAALADIADTLGGLLDPHLEPSSHTKAFGKEERWPLRKTFLFVGVVSLVLWTAILSALWVAIGL